MKPDSSQENVSIKTHSKISISTHCSGIYCRICQDNKATEPLLSPCLCTGTIGFLHSTCLEKWLSQAARKKCELCNYEFCTVMTSKGLWEWILSRNVSSDRRYIFIDVACFFILTPLGFVSSWLCIQGAQQYYTHDEFWTGFGLILLTGFLAMLYLFWVAITIRYHYLSFKNWQLSNTEVRVVFSKERFNEVERKLSSTMSNVHSIENGEVELIQYKTLDSKETAANHSTDV